MKQTTTKIKRIFIANRGEICRRISFTARRLGIESVTVRTTSKKIPAYLDGLITQFIEVDEETPSLYLDRQKMVDFAKNAHCDAIHPGFGFLSEDASFADLCITSGLCWIGPDPKTIDMMASKERARKIASSLGIPVLDAVTLSSSDSDEELVSHIELIKFPLLIKAALGGGGKGLRVVRRGTDLKNLINLIKRAKSEAKNAFADETLILEQYLEKARHIEVQILGDSFGNIITIGDRDCSIQRRYQKIIEESPAPHLSPELRANIHHAALQIARRVGYNSAGTVEFLVNSSGFYFLEMNTRLQVEHPVTEELYGLDLVEWQFKVASGERLIALNQLNREDLGLSHAIEARIYAEDVPNNFMPSPGPVMSFIPGDGPHVRWDIGVSSFDDVSDQFDPMIAKVIARGHSRDHAIRILDEALGRTFLAGPANNIDFLRHLLQSDVFKKGAVSTDFISDSSDCFLGIELGKTDHERAQKSLFADAAKKILDKLEELFDKKQNRTFQNTHSNFKNHVKALTDYIFMENDTKDITWDIQTESELKHYTLDPASTSPKTVVTGQGKIKISTGKISSFWYAMGDLTHVKGKQGFYVLLEGSHYVRIATSGCEDDSRADVNSRQTEQKTVSSNSSQSNQAGKTLLHNGFSISGRSEKLIGHEITAPIPGKVVSVSTAPGHRTALDEPLFVLESMKMEFEIKAPREGIIETVSVKPGDRVLVGQKLALWQQ